MKYLHISLFLLAFSGIGSIPVCHASPPEITVTVKPFHSLVAAVTEGVTKPRLLLDGYSSPHLFQLKPSAIRSVHNADLVIWVGEGLESFLIGTINGLSEPQKVLKLTNIPELTLLPLRKKYLHDDHSFLRPDDHHNNLPDQKNGSTNEDHDDHINEAALDTHFWLDPYNADVVVQAVAERLAQLDPENAAIYKGNAQQLRYKLQHLAVEVEQLLADSHDKSFLVFHDSFQYFESRFNLSSAGVITIHPDTQPSAQRIRELQQTIAAGKAECLFSEPQFKSRSIKMLVRDTGVKHAVIDPLGAGIDKGPEMYFEWMLQTAKVFRDCFAQ